MFPHIMELLELHAKAVRLRETKAKMSEE
jgi:hypothetical protein